MSVCPAETFGTVGRWGGFCEQRTRACTHTHTHTHTRDIIDACAAPGNKTTHLAALVQARQAFFEHPSESIDNDFTANLLRGLSGAARRLMVKASRNPDFDAADTRRCAQALFDATAAHDGERARQILSAVLRRDAVLASSVG